MTNYKETSMEERFDKELYEYREEEDIKAFIQQEIQKAREDEREKAIKEIEKIAVPHCDCDKFSYGKCVICVHKKIVQATKDKAIKSLTNKQV